MSFRKPAWALMARQGPIRRHKQLVFFACEGLIALYDERTGKEEYDVITPTDFEYRAEQMAIMAKKMAKDDRLWMRQEGQALLRDCQNMLESIKEARYMGDPADPAVQAFWLKHKRNSTVRLSAGVNLDGYPHLPELDLGPVTGRTADADGALATMDDTTARLRRPPTRRPRNGLLLGNML